MPSLTKSPQRWAHSPWGNSTARSRLSYRLKSQNNRTHLSRRTEVSQTCPMVDHSLGCALTSNHIKAPTTTQRTTQNNASSATAQPSRIRFPQQSVAGGLKAIQRHGRSLQYRLRCVPRYHGSLLAPLGLRL